MPAPLLALAALVAVADVPSPRPDGWVTDMANVLPDAAEAEVNQRIDALKADLGVEVAVVTVGDVPGEPRAFGTQLFNQWGIGDATADNGLLVLLVMGRRRLEMVTGAGMDPVLTAPWLKTMQEEVMVPAFKRGDFGEGLVLGVEAVDQLLRENAARVRAGGTTPVESADAATQGERERRSPPVVTPEPAPPASPYPWVVGFAGAGGLGAFASLLSRRRERRCPQCRVDMRALDEADDDAHLADGQVTEEIVGATNYLVYVCGGCGFSRVTARRKWFSGYRSCAKCRFRTMKRTSTTEVAATYSSGGRVRVTERCDHCHDVRTHTYATPMLTHSDSSSSSSSSSSSGFSGGSSSGGGAGSSW